MRDNELRGIILEALYNQRRKDCAPLLGRGRGRRPSPPPLGCAIPWPASLVNVTLRARMLGRSTARPARSRARRSEALRLAANGRGHRAVR